jgi:hypothetical protein
MSHIVVCFGAFPGTQLTPWVIASGPAFPVSLVFFPSWDEGRAEIHPREYALNVSGTQPGLHRQLAAHVVPARWCQCHVGATMWLLLRPGSDRGGGLQRVCSSEDTLTRAGLKRKIK